MAIKTSISLIDSLIYQIEAIISSEFENRITTLPVKITKRESNTSVTWNIYPPESIRSNKLFLEFTKTIETNFKEIKGETIKFNINNGSITDSGSQEFQIIRGNSWEVYLYDPETFIYIRLLNESRLAEKEKSKFERREGK